MEKIVLVPAHYFRNLGDILRPQLLKLSIENFFLCFSESFCILFLLPRQLPGGCTPRGIDVISVEWRALIGCPPKVFAFSSLPTPSESAFWLLSVRTPRNNFPVVSAVTLTRPLYTFHFVLSNWVRKPCSGLNQTYWPKRNILTLNTNYLS
jgi:hypothetical protein